MDVPRLLYDRLEEMTALAPNVSVHAMKTLAREASRILLATEGCESPIEQLLSIELERLYRIFDWRRGRDYVINQQHEVKCKCGTYRLDFLVCVTTRTVEAEVGVECDGHDYHDRTKEQAARDKARDRDLQLAGTPILRFTGSEIHKNPARCAQEVFDFLDTQLAAKERMLR